MTLGLTPFTMTASVLSLLLVFRTNASYDRWWEARKVSEPSATCESNARDLGRRSRAACPCAKGSRWFVWLSATDATIRRSSYPVHHRCH
jgi:predicted membrane chloride channel (bestrophin family)